MICCMLLCVHSSLAIILMGKRELVALLDLSSWCLVFVVWLFLAVLWVCVRFVIVVFPDHTHLLFLSAVCDCCISWSYSLTIFVCSLRLWHFLIILTYYFICSLWLWYFLIILTHYFYLQFVIVVFPDHTHLLFLSAVCNCGISWSYSLTIFVCSLWLWYFLIILTYYFCLQFVIVVFPDHTLFLFLSAVCDCGISWSYPLTIFVCSLWLWHFLIILPYYFCLQFVIVVFPGHTHYFCLQFVIVVFLDHSHLLFLSAVCDCGISWSYSLTIFVCSLWLWYFLIILTIFVCSLWMWYFLIILTHYFCLQFVNVVFPDHSHLLFLSYHRCLSRVQYREQQMAGFVFSKLSEQNTMYGYVNNRLCLSIDFEQ